jgi:hypothetical protein
MSFNFNAYEKITNTLLKKSITIADNLLEDSEVSFYEYKSSTKYNVASC